ncbi:MAG: hypothetical protein K9L66_06115 [Spirochaetaceae bacterium]|nr:hypothetical protein [Spirochaetaceae bacterium]MCF7948692.1 hypothetical protein [Spirochaetia bacterium]MCF7951156.1 hypothetical protein [Spirochaetaceae bacterium]
MKLRSPQIALLSLVFVFGGILVSMLAGVWRSESSKVPATYTSGEFAGQYNPADIRGSYSFADVAVAFDVPADLLVQAFGFETYENPDDLQIKLFEDVYGVVDDKEIGTDSMRLFVALYLERPYTPEEDTGLPLRAVQSLLEAGKIDLERASEYRQEYAVDISGRIGSDAAAVAAAGAETADPESAEDTTIKGKTTFRDLMNWGLTAAEIEELIGMPLGPPTQALRDYFIEQGVEFSEYKDKLQKLIDIKR